ncbi:glycoside hydrolase family 16 protein [Peniophora sp. CONT]|nr:glycoside hydrolase family 16 protein [Peniophora sp. CONT]
MMDRAPMMSERPGLARSPLSAAGNVDDSPYAIPRTLGYTSSGASTPAGSGSFSAPYVRGSMASYPASVDSAGGGHHVRKSVLAEEYLLPSDPRLWSDYRGVEIDDAMHDPEKNLPPRGSPFSWRTTADVTAVFLVVAGILMLFLGYPVLQKTIGLDEDPPLSRGNALGTITNATGQIPSMRGRFSVIDPDTPPEALTRTSYMDKTKQLQLVFSDEFEQDHRTFYPGDDPFWHAEDYHYWGTSDLEWYDPKAITTKNGALEITISQHAEHNLSYTGGLMSTWNSFCFTGGIIEAAVTLPGSPHLQGLWPAFWTLGNLGRVGYGATTDGLWPYSYDSYYGTLPNQTLGDQPPGAFTPGGGDQYADDHLSFLPGQRLSRCTCPGSDHPGPKHSGNEYVGRAAPEIDIFESQAADKPGLPGNVSQSAQLAPMNDGYFYYNGTGNTTIYDPKITSYNGYHGGAYQQAISSLTNANQTCYELVDDCFATYAVEYKPGFDDGYITWIGNDKPSWTIFSSAFAPDPFVGIGARPIAQEPMYMILNLGSAPGFQQIETGLQFPAKMRVDYVRVYQDPDSVNYGCDPKDFPTMDYIANHPDAYQNPNVTQWKDAGYTFPKNKMLTKC